MVDGQQRVTTLMLALGAIRDHISGDSEGDADCIHHGLLAWLEATSAVAT
jgi:hypothetical protein